MIVDVYQYKQFEWDATNGTICSFCCFCIACLKTINLPLMLSHFHIQLILTFLQIYGMVLNKHNCRQAHYSMTFFESNQWAVLWKPMDVIHLFINFFNYRFFIIRVAVDPKPILRTLGVRQEYTLDVTPAFTPRGNLA